jgi:hypothetical protein
MGDGATFSDDCLMTDRTRRGTYEAAAVIVLSLAAGAIWTLIIGQDANWDWQNYHEYNAWALLRGRYSVDVVPAGLQTYFNPVIYLLAWSLRHMVAAPYGAMILGAIHGLNVAAIYVLTRSLLGPAATLGGLIAAVVIAATGAQTVSEVGTSHADILTALPVVLGFYFLLRDEQTRATDVAIGGALIGLAVGFKLTNIVFAIAAAAAMLATLRPTRSLGLLAIGGVLGAVLTGGWWSFVAWRDLGNPVFPLFNAVFHSPELADINILDLTFVPRSFWDGLTYPLQWLVGDGHTSEVPMRDARFAALALLVPICILARLIRRAPLFSRVEWQLFLALFVAYAVWLVLFSIQRYAVALELLCGPIIVIIITRMTAVSPAKSSGVALVLALAIGAWAQPADWGHRPWSSPYSPAPLDAALERPATYFLLEKPVAYVVPRFPQQSRFFQLADIGLPIIPGGLFDRRIRDGLAKPLPGGLFALHVKGHPLREALLAPYALKVDPTQPCTEIDSVIHEPLEVCPLMPASG